MVLSTSTEYAHACWRLNVSFVYFDFRQKISTLAKCLKLPFLSSSTFHRIQGTYLVPSIDRFWMQQQEDVLSEFQDKDLIVLGKAT